MTYPAYKISQKEGGPQPLDDLEVDTWPNGSARGRAYADSQRYWWTVVHPALTEAERAALDAYYWSNRTVPFDFVDRYVSPSVTRTNCMFMGAPVYTRNDSPGGNRTWKAVVKIRMR